MSKRSRSSQATCRQYECAPRRKVQYDDNSIPRGDSLHDSLHDDAQKIAGGHDCQRGILDAHLKFAIFSDTMSLD